MRRQNGDMEKSVWQIGFSKIQLAVLAALVIVLAFMTMEKKTSDTDANSPGPLMIEMFWPDASCSDVDLWVEGPTGGPVGYSRRSSTVVSLLRDDLGCVNDASGRNFENVYSRGNTEGAYTVNVHGYSGAFPVNVDVIVSTKDPHSALGAFQQIIKKTVTLDLAGEELTVVRFTLDKDGQLVPGSINEIPKKLRNP